MLTQTVFKSVIKWYCDD